MNTANSSRSSAGTADGVPESEDKEIIVLLLGRRDEPTDGIENDSNCLAETLRQRGRRVTVARFEWKERGMIRASRALRGRLRKDPEPWLILQYTPLAWGPRAFPLGAAVAARAARRAGSRVAVDIHDVVLTTGPRLYDRARERFQKAVLRRLVRQAERVFVHTEPSVATWATDKDRRGMIMLPTGTAIPNVAAAAPAHDAPFRIAVFGMRHMSEASDAHDIATVMKSVARAVPGVRLDLIGRGADIGGVSVQRDLAEEPIEISYRGVVSEREVSECLGAADVFLFLRSDGMSSRRSTVVAGLAHGLPIVGFRGDETGPPLTEAGLCLADPGDTRAVAQYLIRLASDPEFKADLSARSAAAFERYFSWERISDILETSIDRSGSGRRT